MESHNRDILDHRHWLSISSRRLMTILEDEEVPLHYLTEIEQKILREHKGTLKGFNQQYQNEEQWFYFYVFFYVIVLVLIPPLGLLSVGAAFYVKNKQGKMKEHAAASMKYRNDFIHKLSAPNS